MKRYLFIVEPLNREIETVADTEKQAYRQAWQSLSNHEQNICSGLDCVDEQEIQA